MATGLGSSRNAFFMQKKAPIFFSANNKAVVRWNFRWEGAWAG